MTGSTLATAGAPFAAFLLVAALGYALRPLALRLGLVDRPARHKSHPRPTPYLGGVAIALGTAAAGCAAITHWDARLAALVAGGAAMALLGLIDDIRPLSPARKLAGEGAVATAVVLPAGPVTITGSALDPVIAVLWIVVLSNSFNLLDNMDGAAAAIAFVTAGFLAAIAYLNGQGGIALLLSALSAGCLGFLLPHNRAPARMFMGDAGSLFIGFLICAAAVFTEVPAGPSARIAELFLLTFVATVDTWLVVVSRRRAGRSWLAGGTDHVSHRLRRLGCGVNRVALTLAGCAAVSCLAALLVVQSRASGAAALAAGVVIAAVAIHALLKVPVYPAPPERAEPGAAPPLGTEQPVG